MNVKLLISRAGANFSNSAGEIVTVDAAEAMRMIEAGQAEPVADVKKETAVKKSTAQKAAKE